MATPSSRPLFLFCILAAFFWTQGADIHCLHSCNSLARRKPSQGPIRHKESILRKSWAFTRSKFQQQWCDSSSARWQGTAFDYSVHILKGRDSLIWAINLTWRCHNRLSSQGEKVRLASLWWSATKVRAVCPTRVKAIAIWQLVANWWTHFEFPRSCSIFSCTSKSKLSSRLELNIWSQSVDGLLILLRYNSKTVAQTVHTAVLNRIIRDRGISNVFWYKMWGEEMPDHAEQVDWFPRFRSKICKPTVCIP